MIVYAILAVYLIFKGKELVSLAELRPEGEREGALRNAKRWYVASILIAIVYVLITVIAPLLGNKGSIYGQP